MIWALPCCIAMHCVHTYARHFHVRNLSPLDLETVEMNVPRMHGFRPIEMMQCMHVDLDHLPDPYIYCMPHAASVNDYKCMYSYFPLVISHTWRVRPAGCMQYVQPACTLHGWHGTVKDLLQCRVLIWMMNACVRTRSLMQLILLVCVHASCMHAKAAWHRWLRVRVTSLSRRKLVYSKCMKWVKHADSDCERNKAHRAYDIA